ncbi:MAG UNVERIFIED_CONTAM: hypothetical protein LVR29_06275 [Microcystis novacekii LVE1205-3]
MKFALLCAASFRFSTCSENPLTLSVNPNHKITEKIEFFQQRGNRLGNTGNRLPSIP